MHKNTKFMLDYKRLYFWNWKYYIISKHICISFYLCYIDVNTIIWLLATQYSLTDEIKADYNATIHYFDNHIILHTIHYLSNIYHIGHALSTLQWVPLYISVQYSDFHRGLENKAKYSWCNFLNHRCNLLFMIFKLPYIHLVHTFDFIHYNCYIFIQTIANNLRQGQVWST